LIPEALKLTPPPKILSRPIDRGLLLRSIRGELGIEEPRKPEIQAKEYEDDSVRIEELLGWEPAGESQPPASEKGAEVSVDSQVKEALDQVWEGKGIESLIRMEPQAPLPASPGVSEAMVREIVEKTAREIIEKVVWEVVPRLAESEVKKEIERLKKEE
jgi:hypothetical protein